MKKHLILVLVVIAGATVMIAGCTSSSSPSPSSVASTATSPSPSSVNSTATSPSPSSVASTATSTASQDSVAIRNYAFNPSTLTIRKGATVTWTNYDSVQHTVTSNSGVFSSPLLSTGNTYTYQFNSTGSFSYHCSIHTYMTGTIVVT